MDLLFDYLGFLARAITIVIAIMVVLGFVLLVGAAAAAEPRLGIWNTKVAAAWWAEHPAAEERQLLRSR